MGQDLDKVENVYDTVAKEYAETFCGEHEKKPKDQEILHRFSIEIGDRRPVWDFGCGPGQTTEYLKSLGIDSTPRIFKDKSWTKLRYDTISTTSMPDPRGVVLSGFGPVVDDGFGIVYKIENDSVLFTITSRFHMEESLNRFSRYLSDSLIEMAELMKSNSVSIDCSLT